MRIQMCMNPLANAAPVEDGELSRIDRARRRHRLRTGTTTTNRETDRCSALAKSAAV